VFVRDLQTGTTRRVSVNLSGGTPDGDSGAPSINTDGRYVAFESGARDLVPHGDNATVNVFVRDLQAGTTVQASVDAHGEEPDDVSNDPSVSGDGRRVAFTSAAPDLVAGDDNSQPDVFVRDLQVGTTIRVSVDRAGGDANLNSFGAAISDDGRFVAFTSWANDLIDGDNNGQNDVFLRDLLVGRTTRVSQDILHRGPDDDSGRFSDTSISADGRYVAFSSFASNLVAGDHTGVDVFVKYARVITVNGMSPSSVRRGDTNVPVTITGTGFEPGDHAQVHRRSNTDITLSDVVVADDGRMTARLSVPTDATTGAWDVRVWRVVGAGFAVGQCGGCLIVN
jgi:Tol biopolymer transport system component